MNWDTLIESAEEVTAKETKQFIDSGEPDRYQLVDVRQPKEYQEAHLPGAILIPLAELPGRSTELNQDKPSIVYCRTGVRSKAACQILDQLGFRHVFNMAGGIATWQGEKTDGDVEAGLEYFASGNFQTAFELAFHMEDGLQKFYLALAEHTEDQAEKDMLFQLARFEDGHMAKLKEKYGETTGKAEMNLLEGGLDAFQMLSVFSGQLGSLERVLQLGMKLEAQAFDLYRRLAWRHKGQPTEAFFNEIAEEEQHHMRFFANQLDKLLGDD